MMMKTSNSTIDREEQSDVRSRHAARLPDEIDLRVARRLKETRRNLGLTQQELASTLGITFQQLQKYKNGSNCLSAGRLYQISKTLGVGLNFFFADYNGDQSAHRAPAYDKDSETAERILLDAFRQVMALDSNARTLVLEVISLLVARQQSP